MDRDARKHVTCLVNTNYTDVVDSQSKELYIRGGGVCIHKDGLIVTAAHVLPESGTVKVRMYEDDKGRPAIIADRWDNYDVAILWIKKYYEEEEFRCVTLPEDVALNYGEELYAFLHQGAGFYSYADGHVAFPVVPGFPLPDPEDPVTMVTDGIRFFGIDDAFNDYADSFPTHHPCRC